VTVERVMTDNGPCYTSFAFRNACQRLGLKHIRTKLYTPKTNGKAERFIQTSLREWAYARAYTTSQDRAAMSPSQSLTPISCTNWITTTIHSAHPTSGLSCGTAISGENWSVWIL
jgi:transposase InsO family protein